jgi:hypothetical protein
MSENTVRGLNLNYQSCKETSIRSLFTFDLITLYTPAQPILIKETGNRVTRCTCDVYRFLIYATL